MQETHDALEGTPYRVVGALGRGGMGVVVAAERRADGSPVAVKWLAEGVDDARLVDRLRLEAETLARIAHPNVVRFLDAGRTPRGALYYVMERLEGRTLEDALSVGRPSVDESLVIARSVLDGLSAAHAIGVVHRDVSPRNVFLATTASGPRAMLLDFGIAKVLAEAATVAGAPKPLQFPTGEGVLLGSIDALAPEQVASGAISAATDLYGVGLLLYRMLTGAAPFADRPREERLRAIVAEVPEAPSRRSAEALPPFVDALVLRLLAKDPRARPASALEAIALLDRREAAAVAATLRTLPVFAPPVPSTSSPPTVAPRASRSTDPRAVGALLLFAALPSIAFRALSLRDSLRSALDPRAAELAILGHATPALDAVIARAGTFSTLRHGLLLSGSLALVVVAVAFFRGSDTAPAWLRRWAMASAFVVAICIGIDATVLTSAQSALTAAMDSTTDTRAITDSVLTAGVALVGAAEIAIAAIAFVAGRRLAVA